MLEKLKKMNAEELEKYLENNTDEIVEEIEKMSTEEVMELEKYLENNDLISAETIEIAEAMEAKGGRKMSKQINNYCKGTDSNCSMYVEKEAIEACLEKVWHEDWNCRCPYENGRGVRSEYEDLDCCEDGCQMPAWEFARWNGLCSYQG